MMMMFNENQNKHFRTIEIKCELCDFFTTSDTKFNAHLKLAHPNLFKDFVCLQCNYKTKRKVCLERHLKQVHPINQSRNKELLINSSLDPVRTRVTDQTTLPIHDVGKRTKILDNKTCDSGLKCSNSSPPVSMETINIKPVVIRFVRRTKGLLQSEAREKVKEQDLVPNVMHHEFQSGCPSELGYSDSNSITTSDDKEHDESNVTSAGIKQTENTTNSMFDTFSKSRDINDTDQNKTCRNVNPFDDTPTNSPCPSPQLSLNLQLSDDEGDADEGNESGRYDETHTFENLFNSDTESFCLGAPSFNSFKVIEPHSKQENVQEDILLNDTSNINRNRKVITRKLDRMPLKYNNSITSSSVDSDKEEKVPIKCSKSTIFHSVLENDNKSHLKYDQEQLQELEKGYWVIKGVMCKYCDFKTSEKSLLACHLEREHTLQRKSSKRMVNKEIPTNIEKVQENVDMKDKLRKMQVQMKQKRERNSSPEENAVVHNKKCKLNAPNEEDTVNRFKTTFPARRYDDKPCIRRRSHSANKSSSIQSAETVNIIPGSLDDVSLVKRSGELRRCQLTNFYRVRAHTNMDDIIESINPPTSRGRFSKDLKIIEGAKIPPQIDVNTDEKTRTIHSQLEVDSVQAQDLLKRAEDTGDGTNSLSPINNSAQVVESLDNLKGLFFREQKLLRRVESAVAIVANNFSMCRTVKRNTKSSELRSNITKNYRRIESWIKAQQKGLMQFQTVLKKPKNYNSTTLSDKSLSKKSILKSLHKCTIRVKRCDENKLKSCGRKKRVTFAM